MASAKKIVAPDSDRPDKFQSTRPWKTRVFQFASYGALVGTGIFGLVGFFLTKSSVEVPMAEHSNTVGWPFVIALALTGLIVSAIIGGLVALFTRDIKSEIGKGA